VSANRLADATSPYLRQHAQNPVEWYPWGAEAFDVARAQDKPLFISIGYASCHWCHVMAHESFEDSATAADLAASFVSVKVDREERPDVDAVYMAAVQSMTGSGGWPMSVFATPDGRPFFAGTYFPPADRHGQPGFRRVLAALAEAWGEHRDEVEGQADALLDAVRREVRLADTLAGRVEGPVTVPDLDTLVDGLVNHLETGFDAEWGGFGPAPKFPRPSLVELCLLHHQRTGSARSLTLAATTLDAMARGGLYDHLAGGFARYSVDRFWLVPHFEKMLTDQALLARAYLHAWQVTGNDEYRHVMAETLDWVLDELAAPGGGLFSSVDADAAGVEGSHATFTADQVRAALHAGGLEEHADEVLAFYSVGEAGNFEGTNVLHRPLGAPLARPEVVEAARRVLLDARRRRPQPGVDDKVLLEWNAMAATTLAEAAEATGNAEWGVAAERIVDFCFAALRTPDGSWHRSWQGTAAPHLAFAADLAWLLESCTALGQLTGSARWSERAREVADALLDGYWDSAGGGGLFTTHRDAEALVVRPKDLLDGATPSASSTAATALARLSLLTGSDAERAAAERLVELAAPLLGEHAIAVCDLLFAVALLQEGTEIVIAGKRPDLLAEARSHWQPGAVLAWGERTDSPLWDGRLDGFAYVCHHFACQTPAGDPATLATQLLTTRAEQLPRPRLRVHGDEDTE
jgi:hypothetical protein